MWSSPAARFISCTAAPFFIGDIHRPAQRIGAALGNRHLPDPGCRFPSCGDGSGWSVVSMQGHWRHRFNPSLPMCRSTLNEQISGSPESSADPVLDPGHTSSASIAAKTRPPPPRSRPWPQDPTSTDSPIRSSTRPTRLSHPRHGARGQQSNSRQHTWRANVATGSLCSASSSTAPPR